MKVEFCLKQLQQFFLKFQVETEFMVFAFIKCTNFPIKYFGICSPIITDFAIIGFRSSEQVYKPFRVDLSFPINQGKVKKTKCLNNSVNKLE